MARKFVVSIDLNRNELINAKIQNLPAHPTVYTLGQIYYNTTDNKMYYYNGLEAPDGPWMPMSGSTEVIQDVISSTLVAGEGIDLTYSDVNGTLTIDAEIASTSNRGVASFNTDDFNVTDGHVEYKDTTVRAVTTDTGALTPSNHNFSILGGEGVDVTHSGTSITVAGEDASTTNKGVASFNSDDFNTTDGHVELEDTVLKTISTDSGPFNPVSHGISILGGEGIDVTHSATTISIAGEDASTTNKGVASFAEADFTVSSGAVTIKNVNLGTQTTGNYVAGIEGTENEITVSGSGTETSTVTIGLPDNVTITNNLNIGGDLNVTGSINAVNTTQVNISDNYINLNSDMPEENAPSVDAGIRIHRGIEADVDLKWNETSDQWQITNDGNNYFAITRKFSTTLSTSATSYTLEHNLNTRDVVVQIYETSTPYAQIEADVERFGLNDVVIKFAVAPTAGAYRVVITG